MEERDSFVFYKSFYLAGSSLPDESKCMLYDRVFKFALEWIDESTNNKLVEWMFSLIKPQLQANYKRFTDWCKWAKFGKLWGRPKKKVAKVTDVNPIPPSKITPNVNVNVNDNVNVNETKTSVAIWKKLHTLKDLMIKNIDKQKYLDKWFSDEVITLEMNKFHNYWCQSNEWSKKLHWEKQKTFDTARRFITWMSKSNISSNNKKWISVIE